MAATGSDNVIGDTPSPHAADSDRDGRHQVHSSGIGNTLAGAPDASTTSPACDSGADDVITGAGDMLSHGPVATAVSGQCPLPFATTCSPAQVTGTIAATSTTTTVEAQDSQSALNIVVDAYASAATAADRAVAARADTAAVAPSSVAKDAKVTTGDRRGQGHNERRRGQGDASVQTRLNSLRHLKTGEGTEHAVAQREGERDDEEVLTTGDSGGIDLHDLHVDLLDLHVSADAVAPSSPASSTSMDSTSGEDDNGMDDASSAALDAQAARPTWTTIVATVARSSSTTFTPPSKERAPTGVLSSSGSWTPRPRRAPRSNASQARLTRAHPRSTD